LVAEEAMSKPICCSFCGLSQHEVRKMISGPSVHVCNECVDLLYEIVHRPGEKTAKIIDKNHLGEILAAMRRGTER
jgi:ATP-dependent protease Clp ATPase subunit